MLSSQIIPIRGDFVRRGSDETDESALSSGLPTPADEEVLQPFDRLAIDGHDLESIKQLAGAHPKNDVFPTLPKSRSLSKAVMKAKKFAQYLAKSNRLSKKSKSISDLALTIPALTVPALHDIARQPVITITTPPEDIHAPNAANNIFTHPNLPIEQQSPSSTTDKLSVVDAASDTHSPADTLETHPAPRCLPLDPATWNLTLSGAQVICTKVLLFLPWCVLVGGAIVLFPTHLEAVAFSPWPGYHGAPFPRGIRRFALWADCAVQHVMIFLASLAVLAWWNFGVGLFVVSAVLAQFVHAWGDFKLDRSVLLGEDDRQTVYLVCVRGGLEDGVVVESAEGGYLAVQGNGADRAGFDENPGCT